MTLILCNHPTLDGTPCQNPVLLDSGHCAAGHPLDHAVRITSEFPGGYIAEPVDWESTVDEEDAIGGIDTYESSRGWDPHTEVYDERSAWGGDPWEQLSDEEIDLKRRNIRDQLELDSFHDLPGSSPRYIAGLQAQDRQLSDIQRRRLEQLAKVITASSVRADLYEEEDQLEVKRQHVKRSAWTHRVKGTGSSWTGSELRVFARDIPGVGPNYGFGLHRAKLSEAVISDADLGGVQLHDANLRGSLICRATGDNFTSFKGADLRGAKIQESSLAWSNFAHTDMRDAQLRDVNFQYADLQFADFRGAHLVGVDFSTAVVRDADFRGATFENCKFRRTGTQGALFDEGVDLKAMSVGGDD